MRQKKIQRMTPQEEEQFDAIVREYGQMLFNLAYAERESKEDAEEITQEVFLVLAKSMKQVKSYKRLDLWLIRVLENQILHYYRDAHYAQSLDDVEWDPALAIFEPAYDGDVEEYLAGLPALDKAIVEYLQMGYNLKETAKKIGISHVYCRVRHNRLRRKMEADARAKHLLK